MTASVEIADGSFVSAGAWVKLTDRAAWDRIRCYGAQALFVAGRVDRITDAGDVVRVEFIDLAGDVWSIRPCDLCLVTGGEEAAGVYHRARAYLAGLPE